MNDQLMYMEGILYRNRSTVIIRSLIPRLPRRFASCSLPFILILLLSACGGSGSDSDRLLKPDDPGDQDPSNNGYNALFIGHSFFRPFAAGIGELAIDAGFSEHTDTRVIAGGTNGAPLSFWEDTGPNNAAIKAALDEGNVDVFGMTYAYVDPDDIVNGYRQWIAYALENNPDIEIFVGVPWADFPATWDQREIPPRFDTFAEAFEQGFHVNNMHHVLIDTLRTEFPTTNIYCIPYGNVAFELTELHESGNLMDDLEFQGRRDALFIDAKGHAGDIIIQAGLLVWLNAIYAVDLSEYDYDTGFETDLHTLAADIMVTHDSTYNREYGAE